MSLVALLASASCCRAVRASEGASVKVRRWMLERRVTGERREQRRLTSGMERGRAIGCFARARWGRRAS